MFPAKTRYATGFLPCPAFAWPSSLAAARKYCSTYMRTAEVLPPGPDFSSTVRISWRSSMPSRKQISRNASHTSGSRRILVRPVVAVILRFTRRLPAKPNPPILRTYRDNLGVRHIILLMLFSLFAYNACGVYPRTPSHNMVNSLASNVQP